MNAVNSSTQQLQYGETMTNTPPASIKSSSWAKAIESSAEKFVESSLEFKEQQTFAAELLLKNEFLMKTAEGNPSSLKLAMYSVAAVGLSLNPNMGLAYLVPRRIKSGQAPRVCLDISYMGLISLGVKSGSIRCAKAELVYKNDQFVYHGPFREPDHIFDPFQDPKERGELRGGYCQALLPDGGFLIEPMSKVDMDKIRNKSEAYKAGFGPWFEWEEQMQLKCPVKRGAKWWPNKSEKFSAALRILDHENGEGLASLANNSNAGALPPPPPLCEVSLEVQNMVSSYVHRAKQSNAFSACKELMESRIPNRSDLSFALNQLSLAQNNSGTIINGSTLPVSA